MSDPTSWANKRKAAIEHAKKLREQRKNAVEDPDELTFKPQTNKRPSYLKNQDSLDKLASQVSRDPNDPFEQPLPGNGAYKMNAAPIPAPPALSPGSDALGKEMKNYSSRESVYPPAQHQAAGASPYKSKFLQQYNSNGNLAPEPPHNQHHQQDSEYEAVNAVQDPDEVFMNSLRGGGGNNKGSSWNDDTTCNGFPDVGKQKSGRDPSSRRRAANGANDHTVNGTPPSGRSNAAPLRRNRAAVLDYNAESQQDDFAPSYQQQYQQQQQQQQRQSSQPPRLVGVGRERPSWNNDTEVQYGDADRFEPPPRQKSQPQGFRDSGHRGGQAEETYQSTSARRSFASAQSDELPGSAASDSAAIARPNLSLLKRKMKKTESGSSIRSIGRSNSSQRLALARETSDNSSSVQSNVSSFYSKNSGNNNYSDSPYGESEDSPSIASAAGIQRHSGRRSAPSQRLQLQQHQESDHEQQWGADENHQNSYLPSMGQPRNRIIKNSAANKYANEMNAKGAAASADDDDDDGYVPQYRGSRQNEQQYQQQYQQQQHQQHRQPPPQQQQQQPYRQQQQSAAPAMDQNPHQVGGSAANIYERAALDEEAFDDGGATQNMLQCPDCGRKFNPIPYEKHVKICGKVFQQKRKVFDSTKMRVNHDPELAKLAMQAKKAEKRQAAKGATASFNENQPIRANKPAAAAAAAASASKPQMGGASAADKAAKWKEQSNAFREAMKAARQVTKAIASGGPLPEYVPSAPDPSLIPCPHCNRRFNQKAAERHIPQCQNIKAKPTSLKKGAGGGGGIAGTASTMVKGKKRGGFM